MLTDHYHVVVIGAGPSGIAAAVCSSRMGCRTLLLESKPFIGGLAVQGRISTICGLYQNDCKSAPVFLYDGFPQEFAKALMNEDSLAGPVRMGRVHVLHFRLGGFETVALQKVMAEKNLEVHYPADVTGMDSDNGHIREIQATIGGRAYRIRTEAVIDTTGNAQICERAGAPVILPDETEQVPAILFSLKNTGNIFSERSSTIRILMKIKRAVDSNLLPAGLASVSFLPEIEEDVVTVKLNLGTLIHPGLKKDSATLAAEAEELKTSLALFLKKNVQSLGSVQAGESSGGVLHRTGQRAEGNYRLTGRDVQSGATFTDAITRGCWPIELYHFSKGPRFHYLKAGMTYDIPERCLQVKGFTNLFTAGKSISADEKAVASARVIGCCLATGEGAGKLACNTVSAA